MMRIIITHLVVMALLLFHSPSALAQGTIYVSNLGQPSVGNLPVGNDGWRAAVFMTGTNAAGYALNSIQLALNGAAGNPAGFTVSIYTNIQPVYAVFPSGQLASLTGNSDPRNAGLYNYTAASSIVLMPREVYFMVVKTDTVIASGSYNWSVANANAYDVTGGWGRIGGVWTSANGSTWNSGSAIFPQYAINATAIPEPTALVLFGLSVALLLTRRRVKP